MAEFALHALPVLLCASKRRLFTNLILKTERSGRFFYSPPFV